MHVCYVDHTTVKCINRCMLLYHVLAVVQNRNMEKLFERHSPNAQVVSDHLNNTTGNNITLKPEDCICNACYKLHLAVLNSEKHKTKSADHDLKENIEKWKAAISALNTDLLTRATLTTVNTVANHLLHQRVLLPISLNQFEECLEEYECLNIW